MTKENGNNSLFQGRIVWTLGSNLFEGAIKTVYGKDIPILGNDGQPVREYGFGLAIPKFDPNTNQPTEQYTRVWNTLHQEAFTLYPSGQIPPNFAMKYKDGDGIDHNGKPFSDREGYAGHIILTCTTQIPIKWFIFQGGNNIMVNTGIKSGDYIEVQLNIKAHPAKGSGKPGLYLNPGSARLIQEGKEIINAPSGDQIFGATPPPAYAGQVVAPVQGSMPMQQPAMPAQAPAQPVMPAQAPAQPVMPMQQPHYNVLPTAHQPVMPAQAPAQPAMPMQQPVMPTAPQMPPMGN